MALEICASTPFDLGNHCLRCIAFRFLDAVYGMRWLYLFSLTANTASGRRRGWSPVSTTISDLAM
ncbi:hypothetical protein B0H11DRAFT_2239157 [Mycena galericulata]|nr:hypothetical protein B0H11DRAFT_2239157 [Mycena galericulata]